MKFRFLSESVIVLKPFDWSEMPVGGQLGSASARF
jgi:hypothetical protein